MSWLTAALAFALSMLLFTTMISMIVESVHKIFGLRRKGLQLMIGRLYDEVLTEHFAMPPKTGTAPAPSPTGTTARWTPVARWFALLGRKIKPAASPICSPHERDVFLQRMTETRAFPDGWFAWLIVSKHIPSLTAIEFAQRLADTPIGSELLRRAQAEREDLINGLVNRFDGYGAGVQRYFRQRAKVIAVVVSLLFAFVFNIDALALFGAFQRDPALADKIISMRESIEKRYQDTQSAAAAAEAQQNAPAGTITDDARKAADAKKAEDFKKAVDELDKNVSAVGKQIDDLANAGLPLGWARRFACPANPPKADAAEGANGGAVAGHSYCDSTPLPPKWPMLGPGWYAIWNWHELKPAWSEVAAAIDWPFRAGSQYPAWFFTTLFSGLLIGLGGPFWFDVCSSLSRSLQLARAVRGPSDGTAQGTAAAQKSDVATQAATAAPGTPAEAFAAAVLLEVKKRACGRILLRRDGHPYSTR